MKNAGANKAREDISRYGIEYAKNKLFLMAACSGIDKSFRSGYEIVVVIESNAA